GSIKVTFDTIKDVLDGNLANSIQPFLNSFGFCKKELRDEYANVASDLATRYGSESVYFSRKLEFVDKVSLEEAAKDVVESAVAPLVVKAKMKKYADLAANESKSVESWLQAKGVVEAGTIANKLLQGDRLELDQITFTVAWQTVKYSSRTVLVFGKDK